MSINGVSNGLGATGDFERLNAEAAASEEVLESASSMATFESDALKGLAGKLADVANGTRTLGYNPREYDAGVEAFQSLLKDLGFLDGPVDGLFGRGTERAVAAFQRQKGLTPTGVVDAETLQKMDEALQFGKPEASPLNAQDHILFVGMGDDTRFEAKDLRKRGARVIGAFDTAKDDQVTIDGRTFDLTQPAGIKEFVGAIGVSGPKAEELEGILQQTGPDARDEVAQVMQAMAKAERGEIELERMVLSGHSVGDGVWGDNNGFFGLETLESLLKAFPNAAGQVEDFMIAGCYSSSEQHVERFRAMFPNLKTFWAYGDSAPGTWSGAMVHNRLWEEATRGHDYGKLERSLAEGTRKGQNVATWNIEDGYMADGPTRPVAEVRAELAEMQATYDGYFSGETEVQDTQYGPLRDYYRNIQELLGNRALPASERPALEQMRDQTIRLIFFDHKVKGMFQQAYGEQIRAGYEALGMQAPDFSQLSRKEALEQIAAFEQAITRRQPPPQEATRLLPLLIDGLRDLRASVIPNTWV